jgi:hypothetical protein
MNVVVVAPRIEEVDRLQFVLAQSPGDAIENGLFEVLE